MSQWSAVDQQADRELVEGLNEGDEDALAELYDRYADRLYDYAASISQEPKAAADIVHDALIDAWRRAPRMRNRVGLRPWLYGAVRRRCLQRARGRGLYWEREPGKTARPALEGVLARLDFTEQELLVLAVRHGLAGHELGAVTGLPARRVNSRAGKVQLRAEEAAVAELEAECRRCALGLELDTSERPVLDSLELILSPAEHDQAVPDPVAEHVVSCGACQSRARMTARSLLAEPPPAQPPKTLRHRVMHTGTDPELAGYRADIAARGGALTPDGLPRQPDVPSPTARRWIFTGGGMAGAGVTALVAALFIGSGLPNSYLTWPWHNHEGTPEPSLSQSGPVKHKGRPTRGNPGGPVALPLPLPSGRSTSSQPSPSPGTPTTGSPTPVPALTVAETSIQLTAVQRTAYIDLSAAQGTVAWSAVSSNPNVQMSAKQGAIAKDGTARLSVTMAPSLLQFPGQGEITFISGSGQTQTVTVTWGLSLL